METRIASVDIYINLVTRCLTDVAARTSYPDIELQRDLGEIRSRTSQEGLRFLTSTLPKFAKAIDTALASFTQLDVPCFARYKKTKLPQFLRTLTCQVFDDYGWERSDASPDAVRWLRQVCYLLYKLEVPFTDDQKNEVIRAFVKTEEELPKNWNSLDPTMRATLDVARRIVCRILGNVDPMADFRPKHGSGAVADARQNREKCDLRKGTYYHKLHSKFPIEEYFVYNLTAFTDCLHDVLSMREETEGTAKVVLVPKDSRGPRLISCEPTEYQYVQQGLMRCLTAAITSHSLTRGKVNFRDQTINGALALAGSRGDPWVTLDMKEASDRVSCLLVETLFPSTWWEALSASRTSSTRLPNGDIQPLNKFAPMGSAVCFPVESLCFWALSVAAIYTCTYTDHSLRNGRDHEWSRIQELAADVYVYGDDLIVRREVHAHVLRQLPAFGLMFNAGKCCTAGLFRESCGVDAYKGVNVTPLRLKAVFSHRIGAWLPSYAEFHNFCIDRGFYMMADYVAGLIQRGRTRLPYSHTANQDALCLVDDRLSIKQIITLNRRHFRRRYNPRLQRFEYKTLVVRPSLIEAWNQGWTELMRVALSSPVESTGCSVPARAQLSLHNRRHSCFGLGDSPLPVALVVEAYRYALPHRANLKCGWVCLKTHE